jgi:hypothetical protein
MSETNTAKKPAAAGKFSAPTTNEQKRIQATRHMVTCAVICLALWVGLYIAQTTGDMSTRLALGLAAVVMAAAAFYTGTWVQFMWPKEV